MTLPKDMPLVLVMCVSIWASHYAFAAETWHPRLRDLADGSELIVVGHISKVNKQITEEGFNQQSTVKVTAVLKGKTQLSSLQLLDNDEPNVICPQALVFNGNVHIFCFSLHLTRRQTSVGGNLPTDVPAGLFAFEPLELGNRPLLRLQQLG